MTGFTFWEYLLYIDLLLTGGLGGLLIGLALAERISKWLPK
jgi:hypothetical protein